MNDHKKNYDDLIDAVRDGRLNETKNLFDELSKKATLRDLGREVLREACLYNQLDIVKYVIEHKNQQALDDFNSHYGFIFYMVRVNKHWNILNYFISDLNMSLSLDIKRDINQMDKDDVDKVNHMFEMRELKQSLDKNLQINELQNNKKIKV